MIEKDPQSTIASVLGFTSPALNNTPVEPEETTSVDALGTGGPETQVEGQSDREGPPEHDRGGGGGGAGTNLTGWRGDPAGSGRRDSPHGPASVPLLPHLDGSENAKTGHHLADWRPTRLGPTRPGPARPDPGRVRRHRRVTADRWATSRKRSLPHKPEREGGGEKKKKKRRATRPAKPPAMAGAADKSDLGADGEARGENVPGAAIAGA